MGYSFNKPYVFITYEKYKKCDLSHFWKTYCVLTKHPFFTDLNFPDNIIEQNE